MKARLILLNSQDNVLTLAGSVTKGETLEFDNESFCMDKDLSLGHKIARDDIAQGDKVIKYGEVIGTATCDIARWQHVHSHNLVSDYILRCKT